MQPITPVIPGNNDLPVKTYAKDQPQYIPLPCYDHGDLRGTITIRWKLTWSDRISIFFGGSVWQQIMTFHHKLQPQMLWASCPLSESEVIEDENDDARAADCGEMPS